MKISRDTVRRVTTRIEKFPMRVKRVTLRIERFPMKVMIEGSDKREEGSFDN